MATQHLNLEEQEQLAKLKSFWADYGKTIILAVFIFISIVGGWWSWTYWQNKQASEAGALFDQVNAAMLSADQAKVKQIVTQIQTDYKSTTYASLTSLTAATYLHQLGDMDGAASALTWVKDNGKDKGWNALAVLRLADVLTDQKKYDEALSALTTEVPEAFVPLIADKRGNVYVAQGDTEKAKASFLEAYKTMPEIDHKIFVARKLGLLGVNMQNSTSIGG